MIGEELRVQLKAVATSFRMPESALIRQVLSGWLRLPANEKQRFLTLDGDKGEFGMKRSRSVEDIEGRGVLRSEDGTQRWVTSYRLNVDVEQVRAGDQWLDGMQEIEGRVNDLNDDADWTLTTGSIPLILELEDGRHFACYYAGEGRLAARTGHALYRPERS